jgi:hypothetical protein
MNIFKQIGTPVIQIRVRTLRGKKTVALRKEYFIYICNDIFSGMVNRIKWYDALQTLHV